MKILVTGFDPFGGEAINPAWEAVSRLPKEIEGAEIVTFRFRPFLAIQLSASLKR